jgi:hypothetical protein
MLPEETWDWFDQKLSQGASKNISLWVFECRVLAQNERDWSVDWKTGRVEVNESISEKQKQIKQFCKIERLEKSLVMLVTEQFDDESRVSVAEMLGYAAMFERGNWIWFWSLVKILNGVALMSWRIPKWVV